MSQGLLRCAALLLLLCVSLAHAQEKPAATLLTGFERALAQSEMAAHVRLVSADPYGADVVVLTPIRGAQAGEKLRVAMPGADVICTPDIGTGGPGSEWVVARRAKAGSGLLGGAGAQGSQAGSQTGSQTETQMLQVQEGRVMLSAPEESPQRFAGVAELVAKFAGQAPGSSSVR